MNKERNEMKKAFDYESLTKALIADAIPNTFFL